MDESDDAEDRLDQADDVRDALGNPNDSADTMLFIYQSKEQRDLLKRYGEELCLLDATYRTTEYVFPLFILCVKTNVDYQPVAIFVTENETRATITEALSIIKEWNPDFKPTFFMTDYCSEEINALEDVFPGK